MESAFSVKIEGLQSQRLVQVLGTDTIPIDPPIPIRSLQQGAVFLVDLHKLSDEQMEKLISFVANERGLSLHEAQEFLEQHGLGIRAEDCVMRYIDQYQIGLMRQVFKRNVTAAYRNIPPDTVSETMWLSIKIVTFMLGYDWVKTNVTDSLFTDDPRVNYLRPHLATQQEIYEHQSRMLTLADSLFRLQYCEGFDLRIEQLRKVSPANPEVKLEDIAVELQIVGMLVKNGHEIKFRPSSGVKRQDFDIDIYFKKRTWISAEIKTKRDETPADADSFRRTLNKAARQLPMDSPGAVFVRIPTDWVRCANLAQQIERVIAIFFRNIPHVNAVVFVWEEWTELQHSRRINTLNFMPNLHPSPQHHVDNLNELILPIQALPSTKGSFMKVSFGVFSDESE